MVKLIALYSQPDDPIAFDQHYRDVHTPLARKMPGLRKIEIDRVKSSPMGQARYYQIASLYFDDLDALNKSMASPEGKAAAKDLMGFAGKIVHLMVADSIEA
jgi:uncharacterized protein (TIGR02118 family)